MDFNRNTLLKKIANHRIEFKFFSSKPYRDASFAYGIHRPVSLWHMSFVCTRFLWLMFKRILTDGPQRQGLPHANSACREQSAWPSRQ